jgi:uncharacterized protein (DUF2147 family)
MSSRHLLLPLIAVFATALSAPALSAGPEGLWLVKDQTGRIRIEKCGNQLWGTIAWQKTPSKDTNNPDPALKDKPMLGTAILIGMRQTQANLWEGDIYNPRNGSIYKSKMSMQGDALDIKGCVMGGIICGGESWTRIADEVGCVTKGSHAAILRGEIRPRAAAAAH